MKLTLWFLNRITQWEADRPGELAQSLARAKPHDVKLGRRVISIQAGNGSPNLLPLAVNEDENCFRGELMHEGYQQRAEGKRTKYDEYFVPIPLKCLGCPEF